MARGINKVILVGTLGNDPEIRYTAGGTAVATISLATSFSTKNRETGEWQESTEWHRVVFFDKLAEIVGEYLKKGSQAYVEGRLQTRKWQDEEGNDRYTTQIIAQEMQMLGGNKSVSNYKKGKSKVEDSTVSNSTKNNQESDTQSNFDDDIPF